MGCIFAAVMNEALISIGSNKDRERNLCACRQMLDRMYKDIKYSLTSVTIPYGENYKSDFLNQLVIIYTDQTKEEINSTLKLFEKELGRQVTDKITGNVVIDIDLIIWNNEILRPEDMKRSYIQDLLSTFP